MDYVRLISLASFIPVLESASLREKARNLLIAAGLFQGRDFIHLKVDHDDLR